MIAFCKIGQQRVWSRYQKQGLENIVRLVHNVNRSGHDWLSRTIKVEERTPIIYRVDGG